MKRNSWSEISIGNSCAHAQTLARARLASTAWGLALSGMFSSGCILLGSDNDTGQNTNSSNGPTTAAGSTTDASDVTTAAGSTTDAPTEGSASNSESASTTTTDPSATATTTDPTGTGTGTTNGTGTDSGTGTATDSGTDTTGTDTGTDTGTGTTGGGGLGEGEVCQDNPDGCAPGLLCCYPCGVPDCMNKCIKPDPNTQMCPLFP